MALTQMSRSIALVSKGRRCLSLVCHRRSKLHSGTGPAPPEGCCCWRADCWLLEPLVGRRRASKQARKCARRLRDPGRGVFVSSRRQREDYYCLPCKRSASD